MRKINESEVQSVAGGLSVLPIIVAIGGLGAFAYAVGKDLAERDNALQCKAP